MAHPTWNTHRRQPPGPSGMVACLLFLTVAGSSVAASPPPQAVPALSSQKGIFVGQAACKTCHAAVHEKWNNSRHSKMVQPATSKGVKGDFSKKRITLRGEPYGFRVENGKFYISESYLTGDVEEREVQYTLGNRRIQHYLTTLEDGRIVVLPPSWDVLRNEWFHNLEIAAPDQKEGDGTFPVQVWNKNCFGCHVSEEIKNYDGSNDTYDTSWLDFGNICERCHGPGSRHVDRYTRSDLYGDDPDNYIIVQTNLGHERNSQVCAQCHSFRDVMAFGYQAGDDYYDHFYPHLEYSQGPSSDPTWWPDGKTRRFSTNALGIWQSECFLRGKVTCTDCHVDAHAPEIELNPHLLPTNHALCTRCHQEIGANLTAHTFHAETSAGSSCVECHMPRSVTSIKATMRDHSISIPAPENSAQFGIPNACNLCHQEESTGWAIQKLNEWYPGSKARDKIINRARTFTAARNKDPEALDRLLAMIEDEASGPIHRANAIGYLSNYADPRIHSVLLRGLEDEHPLVRAASALRMPMIPGLDEEKAKAALIGALHDSKQTVRMNAAVSLLNLGIHRLEGEEGELFEQAKQPHVVRGRFHADDAAQQMNMGRFYVLNGDPTRAAEAFESSYRLDSGQPGIKYFMAVTLVSRNRTAEARKLLESVDRKDPFAEPAKALLEKLPR